MTTSASPLVLNNHSLQWNLLALNVLPDSFAGGASKLKNECKIKEGYIKKKSGKKEREVTKNKGRKGEGNWQGKHNLVLMEKIQSKLDKVVKIWATLPFLCIALCQVAQEPVNQREMRVNIKSRVRSKQHNFSYEEKCWVNHIKYCTLSWSQVTFTNSN